MLFAGTLPSEWTAMRKLQWLSLNDNMINGVLQSSPKLRNRM